MVIIIAGGRNYKFTAKDVAALNAIHRGVVVSGVVSGKAPGADTYGEWWAKRNKIPVLPFPADWDDITTPGAVIRSRPDGSLYNAVAGLMRNTEMAAYVRECKGGCVLFPGGDGTNDMYRKAKAADLTIYDFRGGL